MATTQQLCHAFQPCVHAAAMARGVHECGKTQRTTCKAKQRARKAKVLRWHMRRAACYTDHEALHWHVRRQGPACYIDDEVIIAMWCVLWTHRRMRTHQLRRSASCHNAHTNARTRTHVRTPYHTVHGQTPTKKQNSCSRTSSTGHDSS